MITSWYFFSNAFYILARTKYIARIENHSFDPSGESAQEDKSLHADECGYFGCVVVGVCLVWTLDGLCLVRLIILDS